MASMRTPKSIFDPNTVGEVEKLYFAMVDSACENHENSVISNGKAVHAIYLLYKLIANAKSEIRVLTGKLAPTLDDGRYHAYSDPKIIEAAAEFAANGGVLRILFADGSEEDRNTHPFIRNVFERVPNAKLELGMPDNDVWGESDPHFITMDEEAYRFETNTMTKQALANFGDKELSRELTKLFDVLWEGGTKIPLTAAA